MRSGGFLDRPGSEPVLERVGVRLARRQWLRLACVAVGFGTLAGLGGYLLGRRADRAAPTRLRWARDLARAGDVDQLVEHHAAFLQVVHVYGGDADLWDGVAALSDYVLDARDDAARRELARRLRVTIERYGAPRHLREWIPALRRIER